MSNPKTISICSRMESLQVELIMEILSRVPTLYLPNLRYVCKRWNVILKDPHFHRLHCTHSMSKPNENRVLVFKRMLELYFVDLSDESSPRQIAFKLPSFRYYMLNNSCNGLLCLRCSEYLQILVLNPFTRQHLLIPVPHKKNVTWGGLGFDETAKLFKVIVLFSNNSDKIEAEVCNLSSGGITDWRNLGIQDFIFIDPVQNPCFLNGRLHWICWRERGNPAFSIVSFDLADEEIRFIEPPEEESEPEERYLIVLEGCLGFFVNQVLETPKIRFWVMKEYGVKASWVKIFDTQPVIPRTLSSMIDLGKGFEGLGSVKDGELVLLGEPTTSFEEVTLISTNLTCDELKLRPLERIPEPYHGLIVHTCSLNWI